MESVHLQLPADLLARVDEAAGDVPRNRWIRRAIESGLATPAAPIVVNYDMNQIAGWVTLHQDLGHPEGLVLSPGWLTDTGEIQCWSAERTPARPRARSTAQVKRDVQPRPKGGKR